MCIVSTHFLLTILLRRPALTGLSSRNTTNPLKNKINATMIKTRKIIAYLKSLRIHVRELESDSLLPRRRWDLSRGRRSRPQTLFQTFRA